MARPKKKEHYVNNVEFFAEMVEFKKLLNDAEAADEPKPRIPTCIAEKILKIANKLSFMPRFINYPFKEEMIGDAIENCIMYIHNFNPEKSANPFAYFTQISYWAFVRRIMKEKKQFHIKAKYVQNLDILQNLQEVNDVQSHDLGANFNNDYTSFLRTFYDVDLEAEEAKKVAKQKKKEEADKAKELK